MLAHENSFGSAANCLNSPLFKFKFKLPNNNKINSFAASTYYYYFCQTHGIDKIIVKNNVTVNFFFRLRLVHMQKR